MYKDFIPRNKFEKGKDVLDAQQKSKGNKTKNLN